MKGKKQSRSLIFRTSSRATTAALAIAIVFALTAVATQAAQAQTLKILHAFTGGEDGASPFAGVTLDKAGNLYGTAYSGGAGYGTVYQLKYKNSNWTFNPLFSFNGSDGARLEARVIFGPNGTLFGTTYGNPVLGTVFNLRPFPSVCKTVLCPWMETVLFNFGGGDGSYPAYGDLLFDQPGNIYGTTSAGGNGYGLVYELTPPGSWNTESVLYAFSGNDGAYPQNGVIFDNAGNLYGTTEEGGLDNDGVVFELMPVRGGWTACTLYNFRNGNDGRYPTAGLIFDQSGNLYGATSDGGSGGGGTVFELTPSGNCTWTLKTLYSFTGSGGGGQYCGPWGTLVMDGAGNLYGTTQCDGVHNAGSVFKLTPSGGSWTYTSLHDFAGGSDGESPFCTVVFDVNGNLYGTAIFGGDRDCIGAGAGCGIVWEITP